MQRQKIKWNCIKCSRPEIAGKNKRQEKEHENQIENSYKVH